MVLLKISSNVTASYQRKENPSKLQKTKSEGKQSIEKQPTKTPFFLFGGLVLSVAI